MRYLAFFVLLAGVRGDWVIEYKGANGTGRRLIGDSGMRNCDLDRQRDVIYNFTKNVVWRVDHRYKAYDERNMDSYFQAMELNSEPVLTEKKSKGNGEFAGQPCEMFSFKYPHGMAGDECFSTTIFLPDAYWEKLGPTRPKHGVPLWEKRVVSNSTDINYAPVVTFKAQKIEQRPIAPEEFLPPSGYKEVPAIKALGAGLRGVKRP